MSPGSPSFLTFPSADVTPGTRRTRLRRQSRPQLSITGRTVNHLPAPISLPEPRPLPPSSYPLLSAHSSPPAPPHPSPSQPVSLPIPPPGRKEGREEGGGGGSGGEACPADPQPFRAWISHPDPWSCGRGWGIQPTHRAPPAVSGGRTQCCLQT